MYKEKKDMNSFVAVKENNSNGSNIIGKLIYYTIGRTLIKEGKVRQIVRDCDIDISKLNSKYTNTHTFKSVTKMLEQKRKVVKPNGQIEVYNIRILDNEKENQGKKLVREIKKEVIKEKKNQFIYLGNFTYDKEIDAINAEKEKLKLKPVGFAVDYNINASKATEIDFDLKDECNNIIRLYDYAKDCYNENRLVTFVDNYVTHELDASPVNIHGKLFFIPIFKNEELVKLEQFMTMIQEANEVKGNISFASIPVMDDEKYIKEYTKEFYAMAEEELEIYQKKLSAFIQNKKYSGKVLDGWLKKIDKFIEKKAKYEEVFKRNLSEIDEDIAIIERQVRELQILSDKEPISDNI